MNAADGAQILVSGVVRELVAGKAYDFAERGEHDLKGFDEPVRVFELRWGEEKEGEVGDAEAALVVLREQIGAETQGEWFVVDQEHIDAFADVTHDHQFIHVDPERAETETPFGGTVAHGFLTLSLLTHLVESMRLVPDVDGLRMGINYGFDRVRFINPVRAGSRVRATGGVSAVELKGTSVQPTFAITVEIEGEERPALYAEWISRLVYDS